MIILKYMIHSGKELNVFGLRGKVSVVESAAGVASGRRHQKLPLNYTETLPVSSEISV